MIASHTRLIMPVPLLLHPLPKDLAVAAMPGPYRCPHHHPQPAIWDRSNESSPVSAAAAVIGAADWD